MYYTHPPPLQKQKNTSLCPYVSHKINPEGADWLKFLKKDS